MRERYIFPTAIAVIANVPPIYTTLIVLIALDLLSGWAKAYINHCISSDASYRGMTKKGVMIIMVCGAAIIQHSSSLPLPFDMGKTLALLYCVTEFISIMENAKACGIPVPDSLYRRFHKARLDTEKLMDVPLVHEQPKDQPYQGDAADGGSAVVSANRN